MSISSFQFLFFFAACFIVFYLCPVRFRWTILLLSSFVFYVLAGSWKYIPFILFTTFIVWFAGCRIGKLYAQLDNELENPDLKRAQKTRLKASYKKRGKKWLLFALIMCIGVLAVVKFAKYAVQYLNMVWAAVQGNEPFSAAWILVPLGISYYTFSTVGYLLDVYWMRYKYEPNFFRFLLYSAYFPHIVQGPISRYNLLGAELKKELRFDEKRVMAGAQLMIWGFFKKLVIADRINLFVSTVYDGSVHPGSIFLVTMILDAFQIYMDFSGYVDIVRGASQIFGVELEQNFNHPFFSRTVPEFWRRWHMSLGSWFKDYVYYPCSISGWMKKVNKFSTHHHLNPRVARFLTVALPVLVTWFLTGLWHGTGITYVSWGIYYGILITISQSFIPEFQKVNQILHIRTDTYVWKVFQMFRTFCCFMGGRLLTSPGSLSNTVMVLKNVFGNFQPWCLFDGSLTQYGLEAPQLMVVVFSLIILWGVSMLQERGSVRARIARQNIVFRWGFVYLAVFLVLIFGIYGPGYDSAAFIYMQY